MTTTEIAWPKLANCNPHNIDFKGEARGADWYADADTIACKKAIAICKTCPVIEICLKSAMTNEEMYGIWGGMTPAQRHALSMGASREQALRIQRTYSRRAR